MALMLAIIMIVGVLPASVFAAEEPERIAVLVDGEEIELTRFESVSAGGYGYVGSIKPGKGITVISKDPIWESALVTISSAPVQGAVPGKKIDEKTVEFSAEQVAGSVGMKIDVTGYAKPDEWLTDSEYVMEMNFLDSNYVGYAVLLLEYDQVIVDVESVTLDKTEATIGVGKTLQLNATVLPENATDEITWESSKQSVATVDENGVVTANNVGKATITATAGRMTAECVVTVKEAEAVIPWAADSLICTVDGVEMPMKMNAWNDGSVTVPAGKDITFKLVGKPIVQTYANRKYNNHTSNEDGSVTFAAGFLTSGEYVQLECDTDAMTTMEGYIKVNIVENYEPAAELFTLVYGGERHTFITSADDAGADTAKYKAVSAIPDGEDVTFRLLDRNGEPRRNVTVKTENGEAWDCTIDNNGNLLVPAEVIAANVSGNVETAVIFEADGKEFARVNLTVNVKIVDVESVTLDKTEATIGVGKTLQLNATVLPENATDEITWESLKQSVATVDENGVVTANNVGEATITATAGGMTAECVVTVTANEIVVPEGHFEVTVKAPVGTDLEFFNGTDGKEAFTGTVVDDGTVENHHQYTIIAPKGMYSYRGMEGTQDLGGMAFKVPVDDEYASNGELMGKGQVITLKRVNYYPNHKDFNKVGQYAVTVVPKDLPEAVMGSQYVNDGDFVVTPLLANAAGNVITYQVAVDILDKDLMNKYGIDMLVNVTYGGSAVQESVFTVREISYYTVTAPKGAKVQGFNQLNNFNVRELDVHHTEELEDGMIKYYFAIGGQNATYRVSMDGKITRAGFFSKDGLYGKNKVKDVVITFNENENPQTTKTTAARIENSSILNVNPQNNLSLAVGEEFRLRSYRAGWQIINTDTANIMIEPDFHYNIISGAEHIKMTPADNQCTGNAGTGENTNWMDITAVSEGTVVLEISYDAIIIDGTTSYPGQFGAVDPSRKSVVVIEIGEEKEENTLEITSTHGTHSKWAWDADLSTVYMFGDKTDFSFTAKINDAQPDKVEFSNDLGKNWVEIKADNSVYTAKDVLPGNNLLKVTKGENVEYQVVRASKASIIVVNMTHPGDTIIAGDTIRVMFSGIYSPTPKMSGIYNPGFTSPNITQYTNTDESVTYSASSSQYGFAADNMMTIKFTEAGTFSFTDGYIPSAVMGNISGQHRSLTDAGCGTNMNARDGSSNRCVLPDLEFEVIDMPVVDVKITTNPKGAEITIDGQTPEADGTYKLEYGTYSYTAKLEGYVPAKGRFTVGGDDRLTGKKDVIIDLKKIEGAIWNGSYKDKPNTDENGVYLIGTGAELAWYAINGGGADAKLTADISMGGYGVTIESLTGTFDGNGHYVTDFYHSESLFKWPKSGAVIKNLGVSGSTSGQGGIVTGRGGSSGSITYTIENCVSRVDVLSSGGAVGGILGNGESESSIDMPKIINCYNAGTVTGYGEVGGIIGVNSTTPITYIVNCYNIGTVNKHAVARLGRGTIRNNYYLLGSATETSMTVGTAYTADVLKTIAKELGDAYLDNPTSYNDGYPILAWEEPRALEVAKAEFPAQLDGYKNVNNYLEEQRAELAQAIEAGKKAIAEATTLAGAVDAIEAAKALMDAIKTAEDIADENVAILARAKNEAKAAITSYKNADDYRDEQKAELSEAINEARKAIDAAETVEEVAAALTAAKKVLDAIPTDEELAIDEATTKVYLSISHDDKFVETESGEIMALRELNVPYFDLANYGLEKYYFVSESYDQGGQVGGNIGESSYEVYHGKVTVLHALIWATEVYYCGIEPEEAGNGYLYKKDLVETEVFSPEGSAGSMYIRKLWGMDENFNYYFNYEYPLASEGWGSTADQILLEDGDIVTVGHFTSWDFHLDDLSVFNFIKAGDDIINTSAEKGEAVEMSVVLAAKGGNYTTAHIPMEGRGVFITKADELTANTAQWNFVGTTDENGNVVVYTDGLEAGKYVVGTPGQFGKTYTKDIVSTPGAIYLTVEETTHVHNFGEWNVIRQATCSEGGIQERFCEDCKAVDVKNIERLAHTPKVTGSIEATCEKEGYSGDTFCEVCEAKLATGAVVAAKGHSFGEWTVVKAASCTETGSEKRACACGKEETREVAKKAHTEEILKAVEATCTSEGLTEGKKCSVCGEILVKQTEVAKKAHTEEIIPGKEATAEESGLTEGKKCSVCGEILVKQEVIEKLVFGDADGDGSVSAKDVTQILRYINGKTSAFDQGGEALEALADVNDDGVVDAKDATQILRHINGKASALDK